MNNIRKLITLFLRLNPSPADAQVHALASALAMDKEELESIFYEMLGEADDVLVDASEVYADSQEVLDDSSADPDQMTTDEVALNDGVPTNEDTGLQEETSDDGSDVQDVGVGLTTGDGHILTDDGPQVDDYGI